jgi:WD40 repeat protein
MVLADHSATMIRSFVKRLLPALIAVFLLLSSSLYAQPIYEQPTASLGPGLIRELIWSPDGKLLVINTTTEVYVQEPDNLSQAPRKLQSHSELVWCVAFSPESQTLAISAGDRTVTLWDVDAKNVAERTTLRDGLKHALPISRAARGNSSDWQANRWALPQSSDRRS